MTIEETTLIGTKYGATIVAVLHVADPPPIVGWRGDWAAYGPGYDTGNDPDAIARYGDKISEDEARRIFPQVPEDLPYRR